MKAVIQRCSHGKAIVLKNVVGEIDTGLVIFLGVQKSDKESDADYLINKITRLRLFNDENEKMNLSIKDKNGSALVVSQFTLCGDTSKGRRPSFLNAASPEIGERLYEYFIDGMKKRRHPGCVRRIWCHDGNIIGKRRPGHICIGG